MVVTMFRYRWRYNGAHRPVRRLYLHQDGQEIDRGFPDDLPESVLNRLVSELNLAISYGSGKHMVCYDVEDRGWWLWPRYVVIKVVPGLEVDCAGPFISKSFATRVCDELQTAYWLAEHDLKLPMYTRGSKPE